MLTDVNNDVINNVNRRTKSNANSVTNNYVIYNATSDAHPCVIIDDNNYVSNYVTNYVHHSFKNTQQYYVNNNVDCDEINNVKNYQNNNIDCQVNSDAHYSVNNDILNHVNSGVQYYITNDVQHNVNNGVLKEVASNCISNYVSKSAIVSDNTSNCITNQACSINYKIEGGATKGQQPNQSDNCIIKIDEFHINTTKNCNMDPTMYGNYTADHRNVEISNNYIYLNESNERLNFNEKSYHSEYYCRDRVNVSNFNNSINSYAVFTPVIPSTHT